MQKRLPWLLFLGALLLYNANLRSVSSGDTIPARLLPFCILVDHSLTLDRYYQWHEDHYGHPMWWWVPSNDHIYSAYPMAEPLLLTPLYVPVVALLHVHTWSTEAILNLADGMEKLVASLIAALSVVVLFALLRRLTTGKVALFLTLLFAVGTGMWSTSSQALWQHGPGVLLILGSLYSFRTADEDRTRLVPVLLAGLWAALAVAIRQTNILFLFACYGYVLAARWRLRQVVCYSLFPVAIGAVVAWSNYGLFGSLRGAYDRMQCFNDPLLGVQTLKGVAGLLASPGRGLLVYTPVFLFLPLGIYLGLRRRTGAWPALFWVALGFSTLQVLLFGACCFWWGGGCYGPRYLTEILPCLVLLLVPAVEAAAGRLALRGALGLTLAASVFVQAVGAFCYPRGAWDVTPSFNGERMWDWKDNPVIRTAAAGIDRTPFRPLLKPLPPGTALVSPFLAWRGSFSYLEGTPEMNWRWCGNEGELVISVIGPRPRHYVLEMECESFRPEPAQLRIDSPWFTEQREIKANCPARIQHTVFLGPGRHILKFFCNGQRFEAPGDSRPLVFNVRNFRLQEAE